MRPSNMENLNSREYLEKIKIQVLSNLERTRHTPSVQMTDVGRGTTEHQEEQDAILDDLDEDTVGMDRRSTQRQWEKRVEREGELEDDSEDEEMADALGVRTQGVKRRRNEANFGEEGMGRGEDMDTENTATVLTPAADAAGNENGAPAAAAEQTDPSKAMGYNGEHDEELEALAKETEQEEQQQQAKDGDGDVEMEEAAPEAEKEAVDEADKMDAEPTPNDAAATTPAPEATPSAAPATTTTSTLDAPDKPAADTPAAPQEGEQETEKTS